MKKRSLTLLEVSLATVSLLITAWVLEMYASTGFGWCFKAIMIALGLVAILLHRKPHEYG